MADAPGLMSDLGGWIKRQQDISAQKGLWTGGQFWEGGHPTQVGIADALSRYAGGLSTGTLRPAPNYSFLETLDQIRRSERTPISWPGMGLFQRAGGPTEDTARNMMDVERRQSLWDEAAYRRMAARGLWQQVRDHQNGTKPMDPAKAIRTEELARRVLREWEASKVIASLYGVDVEQPRPDIRGYVTQYSREMARDAPKYTKEQLADPDQVRKLLSEAYDDKAVKDILHSLKYH